MHGPRRGLRALLLTVTDDNRAAKQLYARKGFLTYGTEPQAIAVDNGYVGKIYMRREL